jgi:hypothetical protein
MFRVTTAGQEEKSPRGGEGRTKYALGRQDLHWNDEGRQLPCRRLSIKTAAPIHKPVP